MAILKTSLPGLAETRFAKVTDTQQVKPSADAKPRGDIALPDAPVPVTSEVLTREPSTVESRVELLQAQAVNDQQKLSSVELSDHLIAIAASGQSAVAQQRFVDTVRKRFQVERGQRVGPGETRAMARLASQLREALPEDRANLGEIEAFLAEQGFALRGYRGDSSVEAGSLQLKRGAFKDAISALTGETDRPGVLDMGAVRELLKKLGHVADEGDLAWAQWRIERAVSMGWLKYEPAEGRAQQLLQGFFAQRLGPAVNQRLAMLEVRQLRHAIAAADEPGGAARIARAEQRVTALVEAARQDPDALFLVKRSLERELGKLSPDASGEVRGHALAVRQRIDTLIGRGLGDSLDRYTVKHNLRRMLACGEVTAVEADCLRALAVTSRTNHEYLTRAEQLPLLIQNALSKMYAEVSATISENMRRSASGDLLDAEGRVIETAQQRMEKLLNKRRELERLRDKPRHEVRQQARAAVHASLHVVMAQLATAPEGAKADLLSRQASLLTQAGELKSTQG